jgi:hypothetical protein
MASPGTCTIAWKGVAGKTLTSDKLEIQICKVISIVIPCHKLRVDEKFTHCLSTSLSKDN